MSSVRPTMVVCLIGAVSFPALSADQSDSAMRDAARLGACMVAMDAACVTALSNLEGYASLGTPSGEFLKSQTRFFEAQKQVHWKTLRYDVATPTVWLSDAHRKFVVLPYSRDADYSGQVRTFHSYLIGVSSDSGSSWRFVDGGDLTAQQVQAVMPPYDGQPLPKSY